jgi:glutamate 5-kinase
MDLNRYHPVSTTTLGSSLGTGGMETKLIAAEIATAAGVTTIVSSSKHPENIFGIIQYHNQYSTKSSSGHSTPHEPLSGRTSPTPRTESGEISRSPSPNVVRPPHTVFTATPVPMRDLKSWTSHTLFPSGSVIIDTGAHHVLSRRESGGRLLAAGVVGVIGAFASGQAVRIVIRRHSDESTVSQDKEQGQMATEYPGGLESTMPTTPTLLATSSLSSSVISLNSLTHATASAEDITSSKTLKPPSDEELVLLEKEAFDEANLVEVGRGLANYNSAQISRVKGLNRYVWSSAPGLVNNDVYLCSSYLTQLLGYADSEYVVENITIKTPPS